MKKRVIYISLGIILVLQNSGKNLYFYAFTDGC